MNSRKNQSSPLPNKRIHVIPIGDKELHAAQVTSTKTQRRYTPAQNSFLCSRCKDTGSVFWETDVAYGSRGCGCASSVGRGNENQPVAPGNPKSDAVSTQKALAVDSTPSMSRVWAMPSADTFDVPPIAGFVQKYLLRSYVSVDPFARNKRWATYTNDLNPDTAAAEHMDAEDFLRKCRNVCPDLVIFDPPYSPGQVSEVYQKVGEKRDGSGGRNGELYARVRSAIREISIPETIVLSFGWNSAGMGKGWELLELLLVCHGGAHNDTICMAERKASNPQRELQLAPLLSEHVTDSDTASY